MPSVTPPAEELVMECVELGGNMRQALVTVLAPYGITPEQHELLAMIAAGHTTPRQMVHASGRDKTTLSRALARAARAGLLVHERSADDRRRQVVRLTERGSATIERTRRLLTRAAPKLVESLSPKERRRLAKLLRKLRTGR
jgi:DNA-binding MarR family transcriptional regulator